MQKTPKGLRLHIGLFGRRNVGKSSLLNALTHQKSSLVSDTAGTTTDPVEKPMELLPVGPVLFLDTAGIDDVGALGELRVAATRKVFERTDLAVVVAEAGHWGEYEEALLTEFQKLEIPVIIVFNKCDLDEPDQAVVKSVVDKNIPVVQTSVETNRGILDLREALIKMAPEDFITPPTILGDLVSAGEMAVFVVPIDKEAPKGRLILPQVQSIRDILDNDATCMVVKERELRDALERLKRPPDLVVTDSQAFLKVAADTPPEIPMTSFSILFARLKGDLITMARSAVAIDSLRPGDRVMIAESCTHHPIADDIGTVKIPRWLTQYVGGELNFDFLRGHDYPEDVTPYKLIIHCGACTWNRREMLTRIARARAQSVAFTNYGLTIAYSLGIFERALRPFPAAMEAYHEAKQNAGL